MPVKKKKFKDEIRVGGAPAENMKNAGRALEAAGFKKLNTFPATSRVAGNWSRMASELGH